MVSLGFPLGCSSFFLGATGLPNGGRYVVWGLGKKKKKKRQEASVSRFVFLSTAVMSSLVLRASSVFPFLLSFLGCQNVCLFLEQSIMANLMDGDIIISFNSEKCKSRCLISSYAILHVHQLNYNQIIQTSHFHVDGWGGGRHISIQPFIKSVRHTQ